jgi:S-adenosylmethionine hydrolase
LALTFSEGSQGELLVIAGSSGFIEVAANQASAANRLGCGVGSPVELTIY